MKLSIDSTQRHADRLASKLGPLLEEGRTLLADALSPQRGSRRWVGNAIDDAGTQLTSYSDTAVRAARKGAGYARDADAYVRQNPWPAIAGGLTLGILVTLWFKRR